MSETTHKAFVAQVTGFQKGDVLVIGGERRTIVAIQNTTIEFLPPRPAFWWAARATAATMCIIAIVLWLLHVAGQ